MSDTEPVWWKDSTCYQIWPASYKDSNGDGLGDIPGIISTLDYLKDLGVDVVWLSPMYASPDVDMGYDISNYEDVNHKFGTMADMDDLIQQMKARDMRLILDLVINHTSDEHAWFKESSSSRDNDKAEWYIWRAPRIVDGKRLPPTNWASIFGGSAWEYVPARDQYYLHLFEKEQPDLNWENPATRKAIYESAIRFWLRKGISGFRVDAANLWSKNITYPDADVTVSHSEFQPAEPHFVNGPRMHEWLKEMRKEAMDEFGDVMVVGELPGATNDELLRYVSAAEREFGMVFDFDMVNLGGNHNMQKADVVRHTLPEMKTALAKTQILIQGTDAWVTVFAENHDQSRSISRFATQDPKYREKAGKMLAIMLASLSGTLFLYQGQEIGMVNVPSSWGAEELRDVSGVRYVEHTKERFPDDPKKHEAAVKGVQLAGRDNARTPVQWDSSPNAGFTSGQPWIRVHDNYPEVNVEAQSKDPDSVLAFWKQILKSRKKHPALFIHGHYEEYDHENGQTYTYTKETQDLTALVVLNFSDSYQPLDVPTKLRDKSLQLLVANVEKLGDRLSPWEGRIYLVQ